MMYLLNTDICIYLIKKRPPVIIEKLTALAVGDVTLSSITVAELAFGAAKSAHPETNSHALAAFFTPFKIAAFDHNAAEIYGALRADLEKRGKPIGPLDTLIAAHALALKTTLVTNNVREFSRVKGLKVETWAR